MPVEEVPVARAVCIPIGVDAPMLERDVDPPIEGIACTREIGEGGVPMGRIAAFAMVGRVEVPLVGVDDIGLVAAPNASRVDVPIVDRAVPIVGDVVVAEVSESIVGVEVVPSEFEGGSVVALGPRPSCAAKESKSVGAPIPKLAANASKSGSDAMGVATGGDVDRVMLGTVDVVGAMTPNEELGSNTEVCALATHGVATSAMGPSHWMSFFMPPPCCTSL